MAVIILDFKTELESWKVMNVLKGTYYNNNFTFSYLIPIIHNINYNNITASNRKINYMNHDDKSSYKENYLSCFIIYFIS